MRNDVRDYVTEHLGDRQGVLIIDDTGFLKKGVRSPGVAPQYSELPGRIESCQIGVFAAYRSWVTADEPTASRNTCGSGSKAMMSRM